MKKIGIDARLMYQTGVGVYLRNLLYWLQKKAPPDLSFYIYVLKKDVPIIKLGNKQFIIHPVDSTWHSFNEQFEFGKKLYEDELDLMHFTYFSYPVTYKKRFIATIHDTTPLTFKTGKASTKNRLIYEVKHVVFRFVLSSQVHHAKVIITPTIAVKKQLVAIYGEKMAKKIHPVYEGVNHELAGVEPVLPKIKLKGEFFICVSNFYPHKNVDRLIEAYSGVKSNIQLVLIGPKGYFSDRLPRKKGVIFYHDPTREEQVFFYKNALALINPSLSEGFGLPLIEGSYFGLPIIASDIEVFRELLGDKYISFDPLRVDDMAEKISEFIEKRPRFDYGDILKKYSFEKMADETLKIYVQNIR
jgi:glycosyltransferase involved in cell wall biosynthesis